MTILFFSDWTMMNMYLRNSPFHQFIALGHPQQCLRSSRVIEWSPYFLPIKIVLLHQIKFISLFLEICFKNVYFKGWEEVIHLVSKSLIWFSYGKMRSIECSCNSNFILRVRIIFPTLCLGSEDRNLPLPTPEKPYCLHY